MLEPGTTWRQLNKSRDYRDSHYGECADHFQTTRTALPRYRISDDVSTILVDNASHATTDGRGQERITLSPRSATKIALACGPTLRQYRDHASGAAGVFRMGYRRQGTFFPDQLARSTHSDPATCGRVSLPTMRKFNSSLDSHSENSQLHTDEELGPEHKRYL